MPQLLSQREKVILYATAGIIAFSAVYKFLLAPVLNKNEYLDKEVEIAKAKIKKYTWLLENREQIGQKYKKFSASFDIGRQPGVHEPLVSVLSELQNLAKACDIRIVDIRPQASAKTDVKETLIDLRADGTMEGYLKFIYNIENSLSLLSVKRMQLNAKPNTLNLEGIFSIAKVSDLD